jgi:parallel beta-helix repeat protein
MRKKTIMATIIISIVLSSLVTGIQFVEVTKANYIPEPLPSGIQIESSGAVTGTNSIQRNGNLYSFTDNINETIIILCDNVVVDGAGYTLQGQGTSSGIFIQERTNITIRNMEIRNFENGIRLTFGWLLSGPTNINILENTIKGNGVGIYFSSFSNTNYILRNNITSNGKGIAVYYSWGNTFRNNLMSDNEFNLWMDCYLSRRGSGFFNDIDTSNTVEGKPVYYWINQQDKTIPSDAGYVALVRCSNITVQGLNLSHNGQGVLLVETNNSLIIRNCISNNNYGVALFGMFAPCTNNTVSLNKITQNIQNIFTYLEKSVNTIGDNTQVPSPTPSPTPILDLPIFSMPMEYVNYTILRRDGVPWAIIDATYPIYCLNANQSDRVSMVYPIPSGTTNITVKLNDTQLNWNNFTEQNPNALHHTALGDWSMIEVAFNPSSYFVLTNHYEHPIIQVNGSYQFLYDLNIGPYLSPSSPNSTAYFNLKFEKEWSNLQVYTTPSENVRNSQSYINQTERTQQEVTFVVISEYDKPLSGDVLATFLDKGETLPSSPSTTQQLLPSPATFAPSQLPSPISSSPPSSSTQQPTAEPSPTSNNAKTENLTPVIIIVGLVALVVVLGLLVYFKSRNG